jgi:hypothetical protein
MKRCPQCNRVETDDSLGFCPLNWLEKHMSARSESANPYAVAPELDDLRSEARFKETLKRMNLPE